MTRRKIQVHVDAYTRLCLTAIAVLLTVLIVGMWTQHVQLAAEAQAADKFGETGTRIAQNLDAQKLTNVKLDELIRLLTSGQVKVQLVKGQDKPPGDHDAPKPKTK